MKVAVFADIVDKSSERLAVSSDLVKIVVDLGGEYRIEAEFV
jgi:hypothetical protein